MKILIIDGQGGKIGKSIIEQLVNALPKATLIAIGTNSLATSAMLKAGATAGATGENPVVVNAKDASIIVGPIGIIIPNSLLGEITPKMAFSVSESPAEKILIPISKCKTYVAGTKDLPLAAYVDDAVKIILGKIEG